MSHYYQYSEAEQKLRALRKAAREYLRKTARVGTWTADVEKSFQRLAKLAGFR